jgi:two-component system CheB/CheR fusion protein
MTIRRQMMNYTAAPPLAASSGEPQSSRSDGVINAIRQPLLVLDEQLRVVFANQAFYSAFAVAPEETVGTHLAEAGNHRFDAPALRGFLDLIQTEDARIDEYEIEIELPARGKRVLLLSSQNIVGQSLARREILLAMEDVTERKRAEMVLTSAKWQAERANLTKSRFLATASHDLRQPLQTLSLMRAILAKTIKENREEDALKLIARLNETADAMLDMLDTLLDINQLESGIHPEKIDFPINDLLEQLRSKIAYHAQARGLLWRVMPCCLTVHSDPRLLEQMIRNLVSNALKYTVRGKILLGCRRRGDKLRIEVWDTGVGIREGQLEAIFREFHQLDNGAGERGPGCGLGLAIVQRLANLLDHPIHVRSRPGLGSVFAIEAPLGGESAGISARPSRREAPLGTGNHAAILVVEDDPTLREMLDLLFTGDGHCTATAVDGKRALALVPGSIRPDIVVADYDLPNRLNGLQVITGVRKSLGREIPGLVLTGDVSSATRREITGLGCVQRSKPIKAEELKHLIRSLVSEQRQRTRADPPPQVGSRDDTLRPTIFMVDDDIAVREAVRELLQAEGWAVEAYASCEAFLEAYRPGSEGCLVVDARLPRMNGLELLERLKTMRCGPPAIMITGHADIRLAVQAMKAGALAFLEKPIQYDELLGNIQRALELTRNSAALSSLREETARRIDGLTPRERQVMKLVVEGNPNKQIAYVLGINQRTVETHRATLMKKVGARSLSELIHLTIAGSSDNR